MKPVEAVRNTGRFGGDAEIEGLRHATKSGQACHDAEPAFHRGLMLALEPADMALRVELDPDAPDQIKLGFEEINMMLLVLHQHLE